jgi:hypothetical protein
MPSWLRNGHTKSIAPRPISIGSFGNGLHREIIVSDMFYSFSAVSHSRFSRSRVWRSVLKDSWK